MVKNVYDIVTYHTYVSCVLCVLISIYICIERERYKGIFYIHIVYGIIYLRSFFFKNITLTIIRLIKKIPF